MGPVTVKRSDVFCDAKRLKKTRESTCSESVTWYWGLRLRFLSCKVTVVSITPFLCLKMLFLWCARFLSRKLWGEILVTNSKKVYDVEASISQWHLKFARWGSFELVRSLLWQALLSPNFSEWYCIFSWVVGYPTATEFWRLRHLNKGSRPGPQIWLPLQVTCDRHLCL